MSVAGRVAVVAGIGNCVSNGIAQRLAEEGAQVVIGGEDPTCLLRVSGKLQGWPPKAHTLVAMEPGDVRSAEDLVQAALQAFGRVDIAVSTWDEPCNLPLIETDPCKLGSLLSVNLAGALYLARAAACAMRTQKCGRIVNLSSRDWLGGETGSAYAATRAGVVGLTRVLAWELVRDGITVNCVAPGVIQNDSLKRLPPAEVEELLRAQPVRRAGTPAEVAEAVLFFAADEAAYITGQTLYVCGGKSALSALTA